MRMPRHGGATAGPGSRRSSVRPTRSSPSLPEPVGAPRGRALLAALVASVALAAGGAAGGGEGMRVAPSEAELGTGWHVTEIREGVVPDGATVTLNFDRGRVHGVSACNHYSAAVRYGDAGIRIARIRPGQKVCGAAEMRAESAFHAAMQMVDRYEIDGEGRLTLYALDIAMIRARR